MTSKIITSPKLEINSYDWKSALRGLYLMWSVTTGLFLIGILEKFIADTSFFLTIDWRATGLAYIGAVSVALATFGVNLLKKFIQENEYIK